MHLVLAQAELQVLGLGIEPQVLGREKLLAKLHLHGLVEHMHGSVAQQQLTQPHLYGLVGQQQLAQQYLHGLVGLQQLALQHMHRWGIEQLLAQ